VDWPLKLSGRNSVARRQPANPRLEHFRIWHLSYDLTNCERSLVCVVSVNGGEIPLPEIHFSRPDAGTRGYGIGFEVERRVDYIAFGHGGAVAGQS
jgi:hypothetical protein